MTMTDLSSRMTAALAPMRQELLRAIEPLAAQVRQNPRLGWALAAVPVILWLYVILLTQDAITAEQARLSRRHEELTRLERLAGETDWSKRAQDSEVVRSNQDGRLWPIETDGIARAEFQEWVKRTAQAAGLGRIQTRTERTEVETSQQAFRAISTSLNADFTPDALEAFLAAVANEKRLIVIQSMRIQRNPMPRLDAVITTYGAVGGANAPAASKGASSRVGSGGQG